MGILSNVMGGLGSGLADVGKQYMAAGLQDEANQQQFERQRILQQDQANLALERAKSLEVFKQQMEQSQRAGTMNDIKGAISSQMGQQFDAARDAYKDSYTIDDSGNKVPIDQSAVNSAIDQDQSSAIRNAMTDPRQIEQGAIASGHFDVAKGLDAINKPDLMNVPFGTTVIDKNTGQPVYDETGKMKALIEQEKASARAAGKQLSVEKQTKEQNAVIDGIHKTIKEDYGDRTDPFAEPDTNGKVPKDTKYTATLANASSVYAKVAMSKTGLPVSSYDAINKVQPLLEQYDENVKSVAKTIADQIFDAKGQVKNKTVATTMSHQGFDVTDRSSFLKQFRDGYMNLNKFNDYARNPQAGDQTFADLIKKYSPQKVAPAEQSPGLIGKIIGGAKNALSGDQGPPDYNDPMMNLPLQ